VRKEVHDIEKMKPKADGYDDALGIAVAAFLVRAVKEEDGELAQLVNDVSPLTNDVRNVVIVSHSRTIADPNS
jgi:hypothetical protein